MSNVDRISTICTKALDTESVVNSISTDVVQFQEMLNRSKISHVIEHVYFLFSADNSKKSIDNSNLMSFDGKGFLKKSNGKKGEGDLLSTLSEFSVMKACSHPCVMPVISLDYDCIIDNANQIRGRESGLYYPFMPCGSLEDVIQNDSIGIRMLSMKSRIQIIIDIATAIDSFHKHGIVHKHVHPDNIFLDHQFHGYLGGTDSHYDKDIKDASVDYENLSIIAYKLLMTKDYKPMNDSPKSLEELVQNSKDLECNEFIKYIKDITNEIDADFNSILEESDKFKTLDPYNDKSLESLFVRSVMERSQSFSEYYNVFQKRFDILYCFYDLKMEDPADWENYWYYSLFDTVVDDELKRIRDAKSHWDVMKYQTYLGNSEMNLFKNTYGKKSMERIKINKEPSDPNWIKVVPMYQLLNIKDDPVIRGTKYINSIFYISQDTAKKTVFYVNPILAFAASLGVQESNELTEVRIKYTESGMSARVLVGNCTASILEYTRMSPDDLSADDVSIDPKDYKKNRLPIGSVRTSDLLPFDLFARIYDENGRGFETYMIVTMNHSLPAVGLIPIEKPSQRIELCYGTSFNSHVAATITLPERNIPEGIILKLSLTENGALSSINGFWFSELQDSIDLRVSCPPQCVTVNIKANKDWIRMK